MEKKLHLDWRFVGVYIVCLTLIVSAFAIGVCAVVMAGGWGATIAAVFNGAFVLLMLQSGYDTYREGLFYTFDSYCDFH